MRETLVAGLIELFFVFLGRLVLRKFVVLLGVFMLLIGARLSYNWISFVGSEGRMTVYHSGGGETVYSDIPLLLTTNETVRLDIKGDRMALDGILLSLEAKILWEEYFDNLVVIYAYSYRINNSYTVLGKRINLMIAVSDNNIALGSPLLKGSY